MADQEGNNDDDLDDLFGADDGVGSERAPAPNARPAAPVVTKRKVEDETGAPSSAKKKARRRTDGGIRAENYLDLEAEEGGGSGDEEGDSDLDEMIDDSALQAGEGGRASLRKLAQQHEKELFEAAEEMSARGGDGGRVRFGQALDHLEAKYKALEEAQARGEAPPPETISLDDMQLPRVVSTSRKTSSLGGANVYIVPNAKDPKLWCCKTFGPERELVISLLMKCKEESARGRDVPIFSAFYATGLRGYIYVEAWSEADIRAFIRGIRGISPWAIKLVPFTQMPQVFESSALDADLHVNILKVGDWVRYKRGIYKDDLAIIDEVKDADYVIKLKPRIDFNIGKAKDSKDKKKRCRPVARWFNKTDVESAAKLVNREPRLSHGKYVDFFVVDDEIYRDGFVYKTTKSGHLIVGDAVKPQEHELQDWRNCPPPSRYNRPQERDAEDAAAMPPPSFVPRKHIDIERVPFIEDDVVICNQGDLKNMVGKVVKAISGQPSVTVEPRGSSNPARDRLSMAVDRLSKYFEVGDTVKAIAGLHQGDAGTVLKIILGPPGEEWSLKTMAIVLSETLAKEFRVRVDHLRCSKLRPTSQNEIGEFRVGTLVTTGERKVVGVIVRLEVGERAIVLLSDGLKATTTFAELKPVVIASKERYQKYTWAVDRKGTRVHPGDIIHCPRGIQKTAPLKAEIVYIHGKVLFVKAVEQLVGERAYLACASEKCELAFRPSDDSGLHLIKDESKSKHADAFGIEIGHGSEWLKEYAKRMLALDNVEAFAMGSGVRIVGGDYKGLRGEVRATMGDYVRVSLLCKAKLVVVKQDHVRPDDWEKPQAVMWKKGAAFAPPTPIALVDASGASTPTRGTTAGSDAEQDEDRVPNEKESWDPCFLSQKKVLALEAPPDVAPAMPKRTLHEVPPSPPSSPASVDYSDFDISGPILPVVRARRRMSKLPPPLEPDANDTSPWQTTEDLSHGEEPGSEMAAQPWVVVGGGVSFKVDGMVSCGWVVKAFSDSVQIAPDSAEVGDTRQVHICKAFLTSPWVCDARQTQAYVYRGDHKGKRGLVVGFDQGRAFLRTSGSSLLGFEGNQMLEVKPGDIIRFNEEWVNAIEVVRLSAAATTLRQCSDHAATGSGTSLSPERELPRLFTDMDCVWSPTPDSPV